MPRTLFRLETDRLSLELTTRAKEPPFLAGSHPTDGRLAIRAIRDGTTLNAGTARAGVAKALERDLKCSLGPVLFEQTDYHLFARSKTSDSIRITHRDPLITQSFTNQDASHATYGTMNFGSQVGRSNFRVTIGATPEVDFEIEVFPTKLDYEADYTEMMAEVQGLLTGLALEYVRATTQSAAPERVPEQTNLEWLLVLRQLIDDLERGIRQVATRPMWGITREPVLVATQRVRRTDSEVRSSVMRGRGAGVFLDLGEGIVIRERVVERRARPTLDTNEHRWLASQLRRIAQRLAALRSLEAARGVTTRRTRTLAELAKFEQRIDRLRRVEPMDACGDKAPTPGFSSLQLMATPGYHDAYRAALSLSLGLRLRGGPFDLSVKDVSTLYEYWCYLSLLQKAAALTRSAIRPNDLLEIQREGLDVRLRQGRTHSITFAGDVGRTISVTYNPQYGDGLTTLVPQRPDLLVSFGDPHWPLLHLVIDAKYRVDADEDYLARYHTPGPPQDAINVLHRYRDAILQRGGSPARLSHAIVECVALFPYRERSDGEFGSSLLWHSLERLGIGAIPALPGATQYLERWLGNRIRATGWATADRVVPHVAPAHASLWVQKASEVVLIVDMQGDTEAIVRGGRYDVPLSYEPQSFRARWLGLRRRIGSIDYVYALASILAVEVRTLPQSPADSRRVISYEIGDVTELMRAIPDYSDLLTTLAHTTALAIERAASALELHLRSSQEWRLYDELVAADIGFDLNTDLLPADGQAPRFVLANAAVTYLGSAGFEVTRDGRAPVLVSSPTAVLSVVRDT